MSSPRRSPSAPGVLALLALSLALCIVQVASHADLATDPSSSDVLKLTKHNFDSVINDNWVFVKFHAPWCSHCQAMDDDFRSAAASLKGNTVLADLDASAEADIAKRYRVGGYPTLKMFSHGQVIADYTGDRDAKSMIAFIERAKRPSYVDVADKSAFDAFVKQHPDKNILVAIDLDPTSKNMSDFKSASFAVRDIYPDIIEYVMAKTPDVIEGAAAGQVYLLKLNDSPTAEPAKHTVIKYVGESPIVREIPYRNKNDESDDNITEEEDEDEDEDEDGNHEGPDVSITKFVKNAVFPLFQELTYANAETYTDLPIPIVLGFFDNCQVPECKILEKAAEKLAHRNKTVFVWADKNVLNAFVEYVGLKGADMLICIYDFSSDERFHLPTEPNWKLTQHSFEAWVSGVTSGTIEPEVRSEYIPEAQEGPLHKVVGRSWRTDVEDVAGMDVVVAQTAPWDEKSLSLKPIMRLFAEEFRKAGIKHIRFADMDATLNDAPTDYRAEDYPTLHYFANGAEKGVSFAGEFDKMEAVFTWIREQSSKAVDIDLEAMGPQPSPDEIDGDTMQEQLVDLDEDEDEELDENEELEGYEGEGEGEGEEVNGEAEVVESDKEEL